MKILILGASGHIGLTTAIYAKKKGYDVFATFNTPNNKKLLILKKFGIKVYNCNVLNKSKLKKIIHSHKIQRCIYAAAVSHEIYAKKNPFNTIAANSIGILNLLEIQKKKKFNLILISTGSVFQEIKNDKKIYETLVPTPKSIYSSTKRLGELLLDVMTDNRNNISCILRISWVYGPPLKLKKLNIQRGPIPKIVYDFVVNNQRKFILKKGSDFRASFTYIEDINEAIVNLLRKKKYKQTYYHLGTGKNNSLKEIFESLKKIDKKISYKIGKGAQPWSNDSIMRGPLANSDKKFIAKTSLEKGIKKYCDWLKKNA